MLQRLPGLWRDCSFHDWTGTSGISGSRAGGDDARARIVGSWRVVSYELEFQDGSEHSFPLGTRPNGYLVFGSDGRMMGYLEADGRKAPQTDEERAAAYRTLNAYTGKYRVQGDKWITTVDAA
jgi:Lipocalin-like domain